ncbi:MAG: hypothetical protein LBL24_10445 [Bacteroidales bacterium]|jgi:hypothetical protein|nr:hypothetical protein [Bacteroidales bacterium]
MNTTANKNPVPCRVEQWWEGTDFWQMEWITGVRHADFDPDGEYLEFVDACDNCWEQLSAEEKIEVWEKYG